MNEADCKQNILLQRRNVIFEALSFLSLVPIVEGRLVPVLNSVSEHSAIPVDCVYVYLLVFMFVTCYAPEA